MAILASTGIAAADDAFLDDLREEDRFFACMLFGCYIVGYVIAV